jgi:hypothetical protein
MWTRAISVPNWYLNSVWLCSVLHHIKCITSQQFSIHCGWWLTCWLGVWAVSDQCLNHALLVFDYCLMKVSKTSIDVSITCIDVSMMCVDVYWQVKHVYWQVKHVYWHVNDAYWCVWTYIVVYWHILTGQSLILTFESLVCDKRIS